MWKRVWLSFSRIWKSGKMRKRRRGDCEVEVLFGIYRAFCCPEEWAGELSDMELELK